MRAVTIEANKGAGPRVSYQSCDSVEAEEKLKRECIKTGTMRLVVTKVDERDGVYFFSEMPCTDSYYFAYEYLAVFVSVSLS